MTPFGNKRQRLTAIVLLVVLALGLRLVHLDWGLPLVEEEAFPAKKALEMWGFGEGRVDLDPATAGWPAFSFYAQLVLQHAQYAVGQLTGTYADRLDYWVAWQIDPTPVILWGRALAALVSTGIVLVGALLGFRLAGRLGFWTAGLVLAVSPLLVRHAQLIDPDGWVGLFSALAVWCLVSIAREGRMRSYVWAGVWIGLGAASKYTPGLLAISLYAVHLHRLPAENRSRRLLGLDDWRPFAAALACLAAFAVATPHTLVDLAVLRRDVSWQADHLGQGHFGHATQGVGWLHYLRSVLPKALGWPALLAGLAGLSLAKRDGRAEIHALAWCAAPLLVVLGSLDTQFDRYMIPLLVPLSLGAALVVAEIVRRRPGPAVVAALLALLVLPPAWATMGQLQQKGRPSTRQLAAEWIMANADGQARPVVTERYGPALAADRSDELRRDPAFARLDPERRQALLARPFHLHQVIPMYSTRVGLAAWFYDLRRWTAYDFIVTSSAVRGRYEAEPERFPGQIEFYETLDEFTKLVHRVASTDGRGPEILIHRLTDADRDRLRRLRGSPSPRAGLDTAHAPHVAAWADAASRHAEAAGRWPDAVLPSRVLPLVAAAETRMAARQRLAVVLHHAGEIAEAEALFMELKDVPVYRVTALGYLGLIAEGRGARDEARAHYRELIARDPQNPAADLARRRLATMDSD